jgi:hypothetical protein
MFCFFKKIKTEDIFSSFSQESDLLERTATKEAWLFPWNTVSAAEVEREGTNEEQVKFFKEAILVSRLEGKRYS